MSEETQMHKPYKRPEVLDEETVSGLMKQLLDVEASLKLGLTRRERRRMGLTRFGVFKAVRRLQPDSDVNLELLAMDVMAGLASSIEYASAWDELQPKLEWEAILEFIKKMLPIILKLLLIFMAI